MWTWITFLLWWKVETIKICREKKIRLSGRVCRSSMKMRRRLMSIFRLWTRSYMIWRKRRNNGMKSIRRLRIRIWKRNRKRSERSHSWDLLKSNFRTQKESSISLKWRTRLTRPKIKSSKVNSWSSNSNLNRKERSLRSKLMTLKGDGHNSRKTWGNQASIMRLKDQRSLQWSAITIRTKLITLILKTSI